MMKRNFPLKESTEILDFLQNYALGFHILFAYKKIQLQFKIYSIGVEKHIEYKPQQSVT